MFGIIIMSLLALGCLFVGAVLTVSFLEIVFSPFRRRKSVNLEKETKS